MLEEIGHLCTKHTYLSPEDIATVTSVASRLQLFADAARADILVTVPTKTPQAALIVAQAFPTTTQPIHPVRLVGQPVLYENEPEIIQAQNTGAAILRYEKVRTPDSIAKSITPVKNGRGWTVGCVVMEKDISDEARLALRAEHLETVTAELAEAFLQFAGRDDVVASALDEGLVFTDRNGLVSYLNKAAARMLGAPPGEAMGQPLGKLLPSLGLGDGGDRRAVVTQEVDVGGCVLSARVVPLSDSSPGVESLVVLRNLTESRTRERALLRQAVVIREIHHRVKNNLQTVASLLRLQARRAGSPEVKETYSSSISRIMSMALVHEILSHEPTGFVSAKEVASKLVQAVAQSLASPALSIQTEVVGEDLFLDSDVASSLCLILNELVQNSFKHAFLGMAEGKIAIGFKRRPGRAYIDVWDNGIGIDPSEQRKAGSGLGLQLVETLVEQLKGDFVVKSIYGTQVSISFPMTERRAETADGNEGARGSVR